MKSSVQIIPQCPLMRFMYHGISSGRLPDQMIRNCAKARYIFSITKAKVNLPRSYCSVPRKIVLNGSAFESESAVIIPSASTWYPWPTRNKRPYTDEYQVTSSDITQ